MKDEPKIKPLQVKGIRYYYYHLKNNDSRFKVSANEIERVMIDRLKNLFIVKIDALFYQRSENRNKTSSS